MNIEFISDYFKFLYQYNNLYIIYLYDQVLILIQFYVEFYIDNCKTTKYSSRVWSENEIKSQIMHMNVTHFKFK